eukprot:TRINITY_DN301_c0_g2_i1.p4 TRINITY_DN301_c0_g2~~TRINITY_DN301_c0_g2_i1.p4  ORF type:complete len:382 (+),score=73.61 TRINITY_DN301_c0_g2_i1:8016-9161(+)
MKEEKKVGRSPTENSKSSTGNVPSAAAPKVQRIIMTNNKDQQVLRTMRAKLQELETTCNGLKAEMANLNTKELSDKLADITQSLDKKASILDLKKMYGTLDDSNERFESIKKEISGIYKSIKVLEENEELKSQKLRITSLESKLGTGLKTIKDIQNKLAETMTLQIMPQAEQINEEEKKEDKITQFMDEISEKVNKIKDAMTQFKADFANMSKNVDDKIEIKASKESLIDLENKIYKEIDKVVSTLTKRFGDKPEAKRGVKSLEVQVKRLYEMFYSIMPFREGAEDAFFIKKPLGGYSCASCEKEISNLYSLATQPPGYLDWNRFPVRDPNERAPKVSLQKTTTKIGWRILEGAGREGRSRNEVIFTKTTRRSTAGVPATN